MDILFLSFAHSQEHPLPSLQEEDDKVYSLLARRARQQHFAIHRDSYATTGKIAEYLVLFRDSITVFSFSGHAGRHSLQLDDQTADAGGIAGLLEQCPKLRLVLLNGCSTRGQVDRLLALKNHPVVIATSAPVEDRAATQFAISFFQAFGEQFLSIEEAFGAALSAAQTVSGRKFNALRGLDLRTSPAEDYLWGLFYNEKSALDWKLPALVHADPWSDYHPNETLLAEVIESLAPYSLEVKVLREEEALGQEPSLLDKREAVLRALPHPISEQLRKLLVPGQDESKLRFYDKAGKDRLQQIGITYQTVMELLAYVGLAQLWDAMMSNSGYLPSADLNTSLTGFFQYRPEQKSTFDYLPLLKHTLDSLQENQVVLFMEELAEFRDQLLPTTEFCRACAFMETLKNKLSRPNGMDQPESLQLSPIAEEKLAVLFRNLGFFARYTLASVKDIDVIKYRHLAVPRFKHKLVKLVQRFVGLEEEQQLMEQFMDNSSVLLIPQGEAGEHFLNLSPFLIDENAFDEKAALANLYFFNYYQPENDSLCFRPVYKPDDNPLFVQKQPNLRVIKVQFDAFARLIFKHPLQEAP